jgi:hypothetical protein
LLPNETVDFDGTAMPAHRLGEGNLAGDPLFVDALGGDFHLLPGSPAIGTGPRGFDMGAMVPGGPTVLGLPPLPAEGDDLVLSVAGPGITHYRYRVNGGPYGSVTSVSTPIVLTGLAAGDYVMDVVGMNEPGGWFSSWNDDGQNEALGRVPISVTAEFTVSTGPGPGGAPSPGDANLDGRFDWRDIVALLVAAKYNSDETATWREGDFNDDGRFNQLDIVAALQTGAYLTGNGG